MKKLILGKWEYHKKIKHKCGHMETIVTLGYKPNYKSLASNICPSCVYKNLVNP